MSPPTARSPAQPLTQSPHHLTSRKPGPSVILYAPSTFPLTNYVSATLKELKEHCSCNDKYFSPVPSSPLLSHHDPNCQCLAGGDGPGLPLHPLHGRLPPPPPQHPGRSQYLYQNQFNINMYKYQVVTKINMRHIKMIIISCSSFSQEHYVGKMELPDLGLSEYIR